MYFGVLRSDDPFKKYKDAPQNATCPHCGKSLAWLGFNLAGRIRWVEPEDCNCDGAIKERAKKEAERAHKADEERRQKENAARLEKIKRLDANSGIGRRFKSRTFETFTETPETAQGLCMVKGYAEKFKTLRGQERNSLIITGNIGTGKTHLAAAVANALLAEGVPVIFSTMVDLLDKIKASFDSRDEETVIKLYKTVELLIIDDLGKERPTAWGIMKIFQIINSRYEDYLPTILTSNYDLKDLTERMTPTGDDGKTSAATVDRIREMSYVVPLTGESWRNKKDGALCR